MIDESVVARVSQRLSREDFVDAVWLFGSEASGRGRPGSDVDLAVLFSVPVDPVDLLRLRSSIEEEIGRKVDLVSLRECSPILGMQVVRSGKVIVDRNPASRANFVASMPSRRFDVVRVRQEAERRLLERMGRG